MEVILLGTGTSQGVPMIGCDCDVCTSTDPRNKRTRTSIHVVMDGLHIQVDAAQELRQQCIANDVRWIDLFILTHGHSDHIAGMDDLRRFCDLRGGEALPVYSTSEGLDRVRQMFPYAVRDKPEFRGYPAFKLEGMPPVIELPEGTIASVRLPHGRVEVLGLVFQERSTGGKFTYYTDCKVVAPEARALARGSNVLVLDGLRQEPHPTHLCIGEAIEVAADVGAPKTYLTHLTHTIDHETIENGLPDGVRLAYDGLRLVIQ